MLYRCDGCGTNISIHPVPIQLCENCGVVMQIRTRKYVIDFTIAKHGHYEMLARSKEEAEHRFNKWITENKKETSIFMDHFTFNVCDIKVNYTYLDGA